MSPSLLRASAKIRWVSSWPSPTELTSRLKSRFWAATSMPRLIRSGNCRLVSSSSKMPSADTVTSGRRITTPTTSLSRTLSARAAPSGMKPSSATARSTRSLVSGSGLRRPLSTRDTDAMDTPATRATS